MRKTEEYMLLPFENIFSSSEIYANFIFSLVLFPLLNNFAHNHPVPDKIANYKLMVKLPRVLLALMLLFPSKHLKYNVEFFCLISECVFILIVVVCAYLSFNNIILPEKMQSILPGFMKCFSLTMLGCAIIDSIMLERKDKG